MTQNEASAKDHQERIKYENHLLYTRVNYMFVLNGFSVVALGMSQQLGTEILLVAVMVILNIFGTFAIRQTDKVIAALTDSLNKTHPEDPLNVLTQGILGPKKYLRPNRIMSRYFPIVITIGWSIGLALLITTM